MKSNDIEQYLKEKRKAIEKLIYANEVRLRKTEQKVKNSNIIVILKTRIETLNGVLRLLK